MKKIIVLLSAFFAVVCVLFMVFSPDYLTMAVVGVMTIAVALGLIFGIVPIILYSRGFRQGCVSIDKALDKNADYIWTAVESEKPFFEQKLLDKLFEEYLAKVKKQSDKGIVISDIEDVINEDMLSVHSWRGAVLQISGILTALGLLGTFLGLVSGISSVAFGSAEATIESIENLLQGIATAFYTSIAGVIISILFNVAYRLIWNVAIREMQIFHDKFHTYIQPSTEEQVRTKQYLNNEKILDSVNTIKANSIYSLSRSGNNPASEQRIMMDILSGMKRQEFTFFLSPVCDLSNRSIVKAACLLRWNHELLGEVQPSIYMPVIESNGFIAKLDCYIWEEVCKELRRWLDNSAKPVPIVLTVRKTDLLSLNVTELIPELLRKYGLDPRNIEVAIDAKCYVICGEEALKAEKEFLQKGIRVAVGNFNGNFVELGNTNADEVCLSITPDDDVDYLEKVFEQARNANVRLTCDGIYSAKALADVKRFGCLFGQGTHLYPAMSRYDFEEMMHYTS